MDVLFREMSRKWIKPSSNLLTVKHVRFIWFVHQQHIFKITSIKLLIYKATVKHFTNNIIFEFCHDKKKQRPNEEPNKMPSIWLSSALLINLVLINLLSLTPKKPIWTTVRACCQGLQTPVPLRVKTRCFPSTSTWESIIIYVGGGGVSSCVWQTLFIFYVSTYSNIKELFFNCLIANHFIFKKCLLFLVKVNLANNSFLFKCMLLENCDLVALDAIWVFL